jgi:hypothetical protein
MFSRTVNKIFRILLKKRTKKGKFCFKYFYFDHVLKDYVKEAHNACNNVCVTVLKVCKNRFYHTKSVKVK